MPARIAATSADEQIKEIVGSGPFRFVKDEWQPGNQVVYVRTPTTCRARRRRAARPAARSSTSTRSSGATSPTTATATAALAAGEVDWWEIPPLDFMPKIEPNAALTTFLPDPARHAGLAAPEPPAPAVQQQEGAPGARLMMDQTTYLQAAIGVAKYLPPCPSVFACDGPYARRRAETLVKHEPRQGAGAREGVRLRRSAGGRPRRPTSRSSTGRPWSRGSC